MDVKPTKEKKRKKVSKKRAHEISRRRESVLKNVDMGNNENLLLPSPATMVTHSAPGSKRGSIVEAFGIEMIKESEECILQFVNNKSITGSDDENVVGIEDLWKHTLPIAVVENTWKNKARRASMRRRSSIGESDTRAELDKLRMEKTVNIIKKKNVENPKFFWDDVKPIDNLDKPAP